MAETGSARGRALLAIGAAAGLAAALWGALGPPARARVGGDVIATVNGAAISRADYERAIGALGSDKRSPMTAADERRVLDNLVDEQLLVERGLELGLGEQDIAVRKALIDAMVQFAVADAAGREPTEQELREYYAARPKLVASDPELRVRVVSFPGRDAAQVEAMRRALRGGTRFDDAARAAGAEAVYVPDALLPPGKLVDYAGPAVRDAALALAPGDVAGPVDSGGVPTFVLLVERTAAAPPPFEAVRAAVAEEWRRRQAEAALAHYIESLRRSASIDYAADAPRR
ncbi:MAG: peptidyl-prolyl cis-trans isomerase [Steroidobacteraceae bacterium]